MPDVSATLVKELSENTAWLKRIATSLVGASEADDLVQETMEAALRRPPASDRPVKPWLRTVLSNAARMHWRSSTRRRERESNLLAAAEVAEGPESSLARLELQREVTDALIALDEPYRQTIILRYVEGLSASAIATRLNIPAGTVRSQVKRGLEKLRDELDRQSKVPDWRAALTAPVFFQTPGAIAAPTLLGGLFMKVAILIVAIAGALVAIASHETDPQPSQVAASGALDDIETVAPEVARSDRASVTQSKGPRRFRDSADRERFARALAKVRSQGIERQTKTYDFSGVKVDRAKRPEAPAREFRGSFDKNYIRERIADIVPLVAECYDLAREGDPFLAGALSVDFVVDAEEEVGGYVREATIAEDSPLQNPVLAECVTETILSVEFEPPEGGGAVRVRYPFVFESGEEKE